MVEMLGLKKPLPTVTSDRPMQQERRTSELRSAPGSNRALGKRAARRCPSARAGDTDPSSLPLICSRSPSADDVACLAGSLVGRRRNCRPALRSAGRRPSRRAWPSRRRSRAEIADRHDDRAELHRPLRAEIPVGDEAADQRRQVNQRGETAVEAGRGGVGEQEMLGQIERQQRPHAVIAEALPHLGGEQPGKLARMAEPGLFSAGLT